MSIERLSEFIKDSPLCLFINPGKEKLGLIHRGYWPGRRWILNEDPITDCARLEVDKYATLQSQGGKNHRSDTHNLFLVDNYEVFGLIEEDVLAWDDIQVRFEEILIDDHTQFHEIKLSFNKNGEFLFYTSSQEWDQDRFSMTFLGLGFYEYHDCWITDEWFWYQVNPLPNMMQQLIVKEEAKKMIQ